MLSSTQAVMHRSFSGISSRLSEVSWVSMSISSERLSPPSVSVSDGDQVPDRRSLPSAISKGVPSGGQLSLNFSPLDNFTFTFAFAMRLMNWVSALGFKLLAVKPNSTSPPASGRKLSTDSRSASLLPSMCLLPLSV